MAKYLDETGLAHFWDKLKQYLAPKTNPIYYGADPTGTTDSAEAINACIVANKGGTISFTQGTYLIGSPILTPHAVSDRVSIDFNGAIIKPNASIESVLHVGGYSPLDSGEAGGIKTFYRNGIFINNSGNASVGIKVHVGYKDATFVNMNVRQFETGLLGGAKGTPVDMQVDECLFYYSGGMTNGSIGVSLLGSDSKICNSRIYGFQNCIYMGNSGNTVFNVHCLPKGYADVTELEGASFILIDTAGFNEVVNCYCDTYGTFVKYGVNAAGDVRLGFHENQQMSYQQNVNLTIVDFGNVDNYYVMADISGNTITLPTARTNHCGIVMPKNNTLSKVLYNNFLQVSNNNIFGTGLHDGDMILADTSVNPYWPGVNVTNHGWVKICSIPWLGQEARFGILVTSAGQNMYGEYINLQGTPLNNTLYSSATPFRAKTGYTYGFNYRYIDDENLWVLDVYVKSASSNVNASLAITAMYGLSKYITQPFGQKQLKDPEGDTTLTPAFTLTVT